MMPAVGDQHKPNGVTVANPFEETKPRLSEYTAQEIATLQSRLDKQLGPEYVSSRPGASGQKVHYLAAEKAINLANEIFGFNGWSSAVQNIQIDFVDENPQSGKISLGLSVIVRVTLKDGTYHEDVGYGHIENCKGKAAAFEKAKKEGTTDALKRALRTFGNVLGNCIYDKDYLAKVTKIKVGAGKWSADALHRHHDYVEKREHSTTSAEPTAFSKDSSDTTFDEAFDLADFDDAEFDDNDFVNPDEVALPSDLPEEHRTGRTSTKPQNMPPPRSTLNTPSRQLHNATTSVPATTARNISLPSDGAGQILQPLPGHIAQNAQNQMTAERYPVSVHQSDHYDGERSSSPGTTSQHFATFGQGIGPGDGVVSRPAGFYSAKVAEIIDSDNNIATANSGAVPRFNPHAESPSIRKTVGVDHNRSMRILRDLKPDNRPPDYVDPKADPGRKLGVSAQSGQSPSMKTSGTSAYRPPTRRGMEQNLPTVANAGANVPVGPDRVLVAAKRSPLVDVSNVAHNASARTDDGIDAKRQKLVNSDATGVNASENASGAAII